MPPQRTDAAIAPYLTHPISHHDPTLAPPDNDGRRRKAKQTPREEPVRFSGTPTVPSTSSGRSSWRIRRYSRTEERYNANDIPDYPPPSFQEAIRSPPVSVCPSTTTLGLSTTPQVSRHNYNSDSESEFDDASFDIADTANSGRSPGPTVERLPLQSQTLPRGRGVLDSDPDDPVRAPSSLNPRAHRRHLSLSPLRTLFPSRSPRESGHALSAQSTPSPYSLAFARSSPFSRSTTSLRNLTSTTALAPPSPSSPPSLRSENFLAPRRFFSHKGKERATSEALDSWEIVESELPAAPPTLLSQSEEVSPVQDVPSGDIPPQSPVSVTTIHPLSERDRQVKSKNRAPPPVSIPARERERRPPPPPPPVSSVPLAPGEGPPIVTVRVKKPPPPPPPKKKPQPVSSPLRDADRRCALPELDLDRAVRTPLPLTPVTGSPTSLFSVTAEPGSPAQERIDPACHVLSSAPGSSPGAVENGDVDIVDIEGQQPLPHHYPGRPLPRRPRVVVDSTYAPHPDFPQVELLPQPPSVPEGLLIDLDAAETPTVGTPHNQPIASVSGDLIQLAPRATDLRRNSSASSVDLAPAAPPAQFLEVTDLDILLARLENDQRDGGNYDALLMVSDFIGPATPVRANGPTLPSMPWQSSAKTSILSTGHIEVLRRRTTKDGRVKLKLALLGIAVDRCGICMTQFKKAERAQLSEGCKHVFHDHCLARWVVRSRTCPLCRVVLDLSASCL